MERTALGADATNTQRMQYRKEVKEFHTKRQIACGLLIPAISKKFNNLLPDMPMDPSEIWSNLCGHFESKSPFHILQIHHQLHAMDLTEREDPVKWIQKRQALYNELNSLGKPVDETEQCMACLCTLPKLYKPLYRSLCTQITEDQLTMAKLIDHLKSYWGTDSLKQKLETAFVVNESASSNRGCGQTSFCAHGHGKSQARGRGRGSAGKQMQCYECKGYGHLARDCANR